MEVVAGQVDRVFGQYEVDDHERVFDECWIVVGERRLRKVLEIVPEHWGVIVAVGEAADVSLRWPWPSSVNEPDRVKQVMLLWTEEMRDHLRSHGLYRGRSRLNKLGLAEAVVDSMDGAHLRALLATTMRKREGWRPQSVPC